MKKQHSTLQGQVKTGGVVDETQAQTGFHRSTVHRFPSIQAPTELTLQAEGAFPAAALVDHLQHGPCSRRAPIHLTNPLIRVDPHVGHESIQTKCHLILAGLGQKGAQPHGPHPEFGIEDVRQSGVHEIHGAASRAADPPKADATVRLPVQIGMERVETGCQSPLSVVAITHCTPASRKGNAGQHLAVGKKIHSDVSRSQSASEVNQGTVAVEVLEIAMAPQHGSPVAPPEGIACDR